ncbi:MAG: hypothetical protein FVQ84_08280 [Planctomycetes bacterium]|nr:hypothetical protein [Planctomycetota bacterium]
MFIQAQLLEIRKWPEMPITGSMSPDMYLDLFTAIDKAVARALDGVTKNMNHKDCPSGLYIEAAIYTVFEEIKSRMLGR